MLSRVLQSTMTPIGIDIGATAIHGAQLRREQDAYSVVSVGRLDRASEKARPDESLDESLRRFFAQSTFRGRSVISAMNPREVEYHVLDVPPAALKGDGAEKLVHIEIGRLTSLSVDQIETRHWVLPAHPGPSANAIGLSVRRDAVRDLLDACMRSRLQCRCIETGATALHRFGRLLRPWATEDVWGILDLGALHSRLILCNLEAPLLIRHAGDGGVAWTERIAENLGLSPAAAEVQKRTHGIALLGRKGEFGDAAQGPSHNEVAAMLLSALRGELNEMAVEVKRSYEYVLNCYPGRRAADLVLVGGGALIPNLPEFLSGILGISVQRCGTYLGQAGCRLQYTPGRLPLERLATAIGLALAEAMP